jgi:hypothetical protein
MPLMSTEKARGLLRAYPFKKGKSELKKALARLFPKDQPCDITMVDGLRLHLSNYEKNTRIFWWFEEVEPGLQFYIRRFVPAGGRVIDVGAHSGIIGLLAARLKGAEVRLVEVDVPLLAMLRETLRLNPEVASLCQLIARPCALSIPEYLGNPTITLEQIIREAGWTHVDLLKIDVDGTDFDALASAGPYLRSDFIEAIYIETEAAPPERIHELAARGYMPYGTKRTYLHDLRRLWVNQTERHHYQALDLKSLTPQNVPSNVLFLAEASPINRHFRQWCG